MKLSRLLHPLAHTLSGPTYAVRRPDGCLAIRVAFTPAELFAAVGPVDDVIGIFDEVGALVVDLESPHNLRRAVYRATTETGRCWVYRGERRDGRPVWWMGPGVAL